MKITPEDRVYYLELAAYLRSANPAASEAITKLLADLEEAESALIESRANDRESMRLLAEAQAAYSALAQEHCVVLDAKDLELAEAQALISRFGPLLINAGYVGANRDIQRELQSVREGIVSADTSALSAAIETAVEPYQWKPINTAPENEWVLVNNWGVVDIARLYPTGRWFNTRELECSLIHNWMPLPAAPAIGAALSVKEAP